MTMTTFPGTTIETAKIERNSSRALFDGLFAASGVTLSQICVMTGLEPYLIQNWVKRGFVSSPQKRLYSRRQFARIVIINMLREVWQIDKICSLIKVIGGTLDDDSDDLIGDDELYHRYVDMISDESINPTDPQSVARASQGAASDFCEHNYGTRAQLSTILCSMLYAHCASRMREMSEQALSEIM
jgi:hypothetical protein